MNAHVPLDWWKEPVLAPASAQPLKKALAVTPGPERKISGPFLVRELEISCS